MRPVAKRIRHKISDSEAMLREADEIGTPLCITVDHDSMNNNTVTIRDRDSLKQDVISISSIREELIKRLGF